MNKFKQAFLGFLGFLLVTGFNVSVAVLFYSKIEYKQEYQIVILMLVVIIFNAIWCSLIDIVRRKILVERPLKEILIATAQITKGNFKIRLTPKHNLKDFDEYDRIKDNLNTMAEELSKSEILKQDFIANLSHEIKTPLAVVQNYAKLLENNKLTEEERNKYLNNLQDGCKKLTTLINNILKLNKLENQTLKKEIEYFNLSELLIEQVLQFEDLIEKKELELSCNIEEDLYINNVCSYLEIVINNLMSNAIKFTERNGMIKVTLKKVNEEYIIKFTDSGCGMNEETGKHIFDKFYQGDTSHSKEGNGLGLALVKNVIDNIGGTIEVESELGKGTTFIIKIKEIFVDEQV